VEAFTAFMADGEGNVEASTAFLAGAEALGWGFGVSRLRLMAVRSFRFAAPADWMGKDSTLTPSFSKSPLLLTSLRLGESE